ncbi:hypothetical protein Y032_0087g2058 [Ancylostoma ceylanicum]|uniref:Uncharacterized protein n=2 Tax=Ancylostoma ceylanicum TaxID=53326 RepID=A0A016TP85_9BILA|nr:hypothetical protein Y032_0087g2058 [Ancylostoma ceylanicum]
MTVRALFNDCTTSSDVERPDGHCRALRRLLLRARTIPCLRPYNPRWRSSSVLRACASLISRTSSYVSHASRRRDNGMRELFFLALLLTIVAIIYATPEESSILRVKRQFGWGWGRPWGWGGMWGNGMWGGGMWGGGMYPGMWGMYG